MKEWEGEGGCRRWKQFSCLLTGPGGAGWTKEEARLGIQVREGEQLIPFSLNVNMCINKFNFILYLCTLNVCESTILPAVLMKYSRVECCH